MQSERKQETSLTVDVKGVCQIAGISPATLYRMLANKSAPQGVKVTPKMRKWQRSEIIAWVEGGFKMVQDGVTS